MPTLHPPVCENFCTTRCTTKGSIFPAWHNPRVTVPRGACRTTGGDSQYSPKGTVCQVPRFRNRIRFALKRIDTKGTVIFETCPVHTSAKRYSPVIFRQQHHKNIHLCRLLSGNLSGPRTTKLRPPPGVTQRTNPTPAGLSPSSPGQSPPRYAQTDTYLPEVRCALSPIHRDAPSRAGNDTYGTVHFFVQPIHTPDT